MKVETYKFLQSRRNWHFKLGLAAFVSAIFFGAFSKYWHSECLGIAAGLWFTISAFAFVVTSELDRKIAARTILASITKAELDEFFEAVQARLESAVPIANKLLAKVEKQNGGDFTVLKEAELLAKVMTGSALSDALGTLVKQMMYS